MDPRRRVLHQGVLASRRRDLEPQGVQDSGSPVEAGGALAQPKLRNHVRGGHANHVHLPHDLQRVSPRRSGMQALLLQTVCPCRA